MYENMVEYPLLVDQGFFEDFFLAGWIVGMKSSVLPGPASNKQ